MDATVLDFWQWAFSDLCFNDVRGVFAEWLVAKLLGIELSTRDSWSPWDLATATGLRIQVKSAAYVQAWPRSRESKIVFTGLKRHAWDAETGPMASEADYNADLFIFCVHTERSEQSWNALDLSQWVFYVVERAILQQLNQKGLSLATLGRLAEPISADQLPACVDACGQQILASRADHP